MMKHLLRLLIVTAPLLGCDHGGSVKESAWRRSEPEGVKYENGRVINNEDEVGVQKTWTWQPH